MTGHYYVEPSPVFTNLLRKSMVLTLQVYRRNLKSSQEIHVGKCVEVTFRPTTDIAANCI